MNKFATVIRVLKGGPGSGNFEHSGREGERGGSGGGGGGGGEKSPSNLEPRTGNSAFNEKHGDADIYLDQTNSSYSRMDDLASEFIDSDNKKQVIRIFRTEAESFENDLDKVTNFLSESKDEFDDPKYGNLSLEIEDGLDVIERQIYSARDYNVSGDLGKALARYNSALNDAKKLMRKIPIKKGFLEVISTIKAMSTSSDSSIVPTKTLGGKKKKPIDQYRVGGFKKVLGILKGGSGSGDFSHAGRPGEVGGSAGGGGGGGSSSRGGGGGKPKGGGSKEEKKPSGGRDVKGRFIAGKVKSAKNDLKQARQVMARGGDSNHSKANEIASEAYTKLGNAIEKLPSGVDKKRLQEKHEGFVNSKGGVKFISQLDSLAVELLQQAKSIVS